MQVQAAIPNSDGLLRSGMFARASILLPAQKDQIVLPQTAITFTLYGENVYLVSKSHDELIERNKIDVADLSIGYVGEEYNTGNFIIAAIDSKSNVYTFTHDHKGKISLTVHQTR